MYEVVGRNATLKIYGRSFGKGTSRNAESQGGHGIFIEITYRIGHDIKTGLDQGFGTGPYNNASLQFLSASLFSRTRGKW